MLLVSGSVCAVLYVFQVSLRIKRMHKKSKPMSNGKLNIIITDILGGLIYGGMSLMKNGPVFLNFPKTG